MKFLHFHSLNSAEFIRKNHMCIDLRSTNEILRLNKLKIKQKCFYIKNSVAAMCQLLTKPDFHKFQISSAHTHNTFNCVMLNVWSAHIFFVGFLSFFLPPSRVRFSHMFFSSLPPFWWCECEDKVRRAAAVAAHILIRV